MAFSPAAPRNDPVDLLQEPLLTRLADRLVDEARACAGHPASLYVADLEGRCLIRVAGEEDMPHEIAVDQLVGPEIPEHRAGELAEALGVPAVVPLSLRGRALAVLAFAGVPEGDLGLLATHGAAAVEIAERYTDVFARARRRRTPSAAGELQQELMPPRIARVPGALVAGTILPAYDVGGDWIDHCETPDGAWLAVADAVGKGPQAEAIGAIGLASYRAVRRSGGHSLADAARAIHETVAALGMDEIFTSALLVAWEGPTRRLTWLRCGHPPPLLWHPERGLRMLEGGDGPVLGLPRLSPLLEPATATLAHDDALVLLSDGVFERASPTGERLGEEGVVAGLRRAPTTEPTALVAAVMDAVSAHHYGPLRDDASMLVLRPSER